MDPNGGTNPSIPNLEGVQPQQNQFANADISPNATSQSVPTLDTLNLDSQPTTASIAPGAGESLLPQQNQITSTKQKGGGSGKKIILSIIGFIVVAGLIGGAYVFGFTTGKTAGKNESDAAYQKKQAAAQAEESKDETDAEETSQPDSSALTLTDLKEPKYIDESIDGEIGKQLEASDGLVLKVTNIERNFKSTDPNYKLDSTKELVKVNFLVGNVTKDKTKDISSFNFRLENSANAQLTPENITTYSDKFDTLKLEPGAQSKGSIVYAVNKDEKPLKFVREQRYRISGENREVTTRIVVSIAK